MQNRATEIHNRMCNVMGGDAPSLSTVCRWSLQFKRGRESIDDDPRSGRPTEVTQPEVIAAVKKEFYKIDE